MSQRTLAHAALFLVNLIYGVNYAVAKGLMPTVIGPSGFILVRVLGAVVLFWALRAWLPERVAWSDALRLTLCGVFGVAVNQLCFFQGLMRTSPLHASLIMVAAPILVLVFSAALLGERITWGKAAGITMGAIGATVLLFQGASGDAGATLEGDLFILVNAASFALYLVMVKPLMRAYTAVTVMAWTFAIGSVLVLPFGAGELAQVPWSGLDGATWLAIAYVVVGVTFVAYLLNTWALRVLDPGVVGTYIYLQPMMAVGFAWFYAVTGLAPAGRGVDVPEIRVVHGLCTLLIFLGVHLVNRSDRRA